MSQQTVSQSLSRVEFEVHFQTGRRGRRHLRNGSCLKNPPLPNEDLPRLTRLLALAHRWNRLMDEGVVSSYAEIASLMGLSRARVTQIMDLLYLAPDIQDEILMSPSKGSFAPDVPEREMRRITQTPGWAEQRKLLRGSREE